MNTKNKILASIGFILLIAFVFTGCLYAATFYYNGKSIPSQKYLGHSISGLTYPEAQSKVEKLNNKLSQTNLSISYQDMETKVFLQDIQSSIQSDQIFSEVKFYQGSPTISQLVTDYFKSKTYSPQIKLDSNKVSTKISKKLPNLTSTQNAKFTSPTEIQAEVEGKEIDVDKLQSDLQKQLSKKPNQIKTLVLSSSPSKATVTQSDLEPFQENLQRLADNPLQITYADQTFQLSLYDKISSINFQKDEAQTLQATLDQTFLLNYLDQTIRPKVYEAPGQLQISYNQSKDKAEFSDDSKPGIDLNLETTQIVINQAITKAIFESINQPVSVATISLQPGLVIDDQLKSRGVKELIDTGYTTFIGSTANRIHNINVGMNTFNGLIIPAGEEFSFNQNLGPVDASTGYKPELVIKSYGTVPEYGGGLCQVSSTMYRAALMSGLDITERDNHSYAVGYYAQVLGHGLDATIYPGVKDLKFKNNTGSDIVVQAYAEGTSAYFKFYGTKHIDRVELVGPINSNYHSPGPESVTVDPSLPAGTVKVMDTPVTGFNSYWERIIYDKDNNKTVEEIFSDYRAVNRKLTVSPDYYAENEESQTSEQTQQSEPTQEEFQEV